MASLFRRPAWLFIVAALVAAPAAAYAAPENSTIYYQRVDSTAVPDWGNPRQVVVSAQGDNESAVAAAVKATGAAVYHYAEPYWFPADRTLEGINIADHMDWAFCDNTGSPMAGQTVTNRNGVKIPWYYLDMNERAARDGFTAYLRNIKAWGYDGVFIDLGTRAEITGPVSGAVSGCTDDPVHPGATFAAAYLDAVRQAQAIGLRVWLSYKPGRRNPIPARLYASLDLTLDELSTGRAWASAIAGHKAAEAAGNVVALVKSRLHDPVARRGDVFYQWARAKLYVESVAVNNGDDGCGGYDPGGSPTCTRFGNYPDLTRVSLGAPVDAHPLARSCTTSTACLWVRRYKRGLVVVNQRPASARLRLSTGLGGCRYVYGVYAGRQGSDCVSTVRYSLPGHSGRVYTYSAKLVVNGG